MVRRFRGMGKGRKTRRALERGGAGPAKPLNETVATWSGVRIAALLLIGNLAGEQPVFRKTAPDVRYVGSKTCAGCHRSIY